MGQPVRPTYEPGPEVATRLRWVRDRLLGCFARYPSWDSLAHAPLDGLETALRPLGLWRQKALAFQQLARSIEAHGGVLPRTRTEVERLPGIGPYTASALLA